MFEGVTGAQWLAAGSQVLSGVLSGGKPAGSSAAINESPVTQWFDSSGWTVATGKASARGGDREQVDGGGGWFAQNAPLLIVAAVVALYAWRRS